MKKGYLMLSLLASVLSLKAAASDHSFQVQGKDIHNGFIVEKIWLDHYAVPEVKISGISVMEGLRPDGVKLLPADQLTVGIGMECKRPFAVVRIPAYSAGATGASARQVTAFTLTVTEQTQPQQSTAAAKTTATAAANSVLASGTWYKIAITKTGFYKLDYNFIKSMGVDPANIKASDIRVFGNGGNMLAEGNSKWRADDLLENALLVNDGGDNVLNSGDYAMFYAVGPTAWLKDSTNQRFTHQTNLYTDTAYYFVTFDHGAGLRAGAQGSVGTSNINVTDYNHYDLHETDLLNPAGLGKIWYGEQFSPLLNNTTQSFNFDMGSTVSTVHCKMQMGCAQLSAGGSSTQMTVNGQAVGNSGFGDKTDDTYVMRLLTLENDVTCNAQNIQATIQMTPSAQDAIGYLDYIELNTRRGLIMNGDQMGFRDWQSVGAGHIANFQLSSANGNTRVWDVTNPQVPVQMNGSLNGSTYSFTQDAAMLHEYAAFNGSNLYAPQYISKVGNQNIHGNAQVDLIIVTNPAFMSDAQQLASYHSQHDNMRVLTVTTDQVYNEFSSGGQDICAIRDMVRMFYKRAGSDPSQMPHNLILFGGASYDYKNRIPNNSNFIPVFESAICDNSVSGYSTDDFFGFLDDNEDINDPSQYNTLDVGIGRLPARSEADAAALVNKIVNYRSPATLGPWRMAVTIVGDNGWALDPKTGCTPDGAGDHMQDAQDMSAMINLKANGLYNQTKVYLDAIPIISTPGGDRAPDANAAINDRVFKGTFMMNYNGHGNPQVWAHERILTQDDFSKWTNEHMLPFMVTATCDFGQFDHPQFVSAAELLVKQARGGVITVLTTTAAVYANYNNTINQEYLSAQFTRNAGGHWNTFGEACSIGKNVTYAISASSDELGNYYKFALLGDPALQPDFPEELVHIDSIEDGITFQPTTTVQALGKYVIKGSVTDKAGSLLSGFNGDLWMSLYDKPRTVVTISCHNDVFKTQDNIVYKGKVTVVNGKFQVTFIAPKDINYNLGTAKISTYAHNGVTDASGADTSIQVGGFSDNPQLSTQAPIVKPYINDSLFQNWGVTGSNTSLFVILNSETGINVSGNNLGHDLIAVLDDNVEQPYILNDYYETAPNTYQRGYVTFPINGLADGKHSLRVKAWDVNNNSGEGTVDFIVVDGQVMDIENLMNYPNPFANTTHFVFEHNHPDEQLDVTIAIYNAAGALVKKIQQQFVPTGSRSGDLSWDGTDSNGDRLPSGLYVYKLNIVTEKGFQSTAYQKLVIVR